MTKHSVLLGPYDDAEQFARAYLEYVSKLIRQMDIRSIAALIAELEQARSAGTRCSLWETGVLPLPPPPWRTT